MTLLYVNYLMTHAKNVVQDCTSTILNKYRLCLNSCNLNWRQWKMGCNGCSHETDIVAPSRKHEHTCLGCFAEKHFWINRRQLMPLCALQCLHHLPLYTMWCCFESTQCDTNITQTLRCSIGSTRMSCSRTLHHREPELNPLYDTTILFLVRYPISRNIAV